MRPRTIILAFACVLFINALIVLGVWLWFNGKTPDSLQAAAVVPETNSTADREVVAEPIEPNDPASTVTNPALPVAAGGATWAEFDSPHDGDAVPRRFSASGRCGSIPTGHRLMAVVQTGRVFSPKMPPLDIEGHNWSGTVNEFGVPVGGAFTLCVFAVSEEGVQQIAQWNAQGKATGKYPPFRQGVPGGTCLAKIKLRVTKGGNA
jgi:hypothetical protein